jgi:hypothetical protein
MLENALLACPDELWCISLWIPEDNQQPASSQFWYVVYHSLFWLDLYLTGSIDGFAPPPPFTMDEIDPAGLYPERQYTKEELLSYLEHDRKKCRETIEGLSDVKAHQLCRFSWGEVSFAELLLDNMRHVQEHAAQLNLILGQKRGISSRWVAQVKNSPNQNEHE